MRLPDLIALSLSPRCRDCFSQDTAKERRRACRIVSLTGLAPRNTGGKRTPRPLLPPAAGVFCRLLRSAPDRREALSHGLRQTAPVVATCELKVASTIALKSRTERVRVQRSPAAKPFATLQGQPPRRQSLRHSG
jgi:hypothetical protein